MVRTDNIGHPATEGHPRYLIHGTTPVNSTFHALSLHWSCHFRKIAQTGFWRVRDAGNSADHASVAGSLLARLRTRRRERGIRVAPQTLAAPPHLVAVPGSSVFFAPGAPRPLFVYRGSYYSFQRGTWFRSAAPELRELDRADRVPTPCSACRRYSPKPPRCRQRRLKLGLDRRSPFRGASRYGRGQRGSEQVQLSIQSV